jgi:hypothetical protein
MMDALQDLDALDPGLDPAPEVQEVVGLVLLQHLLQQESVL